VAVNINHFSPFSKQYITCAVLADSPAMQPIQQFAGSNYTHGWRRPSSMNSPTCYLHNALWHRYTCCITTLCTYC